MSNFKLYNEMDNHSKLNLNVQYALLCITVRCKQLHG